RPDPVAAPAGEEPDTGRGGQCQVPLLAGRGSEVEAGRAVDDQPRLELTIRDRLADVGVLHPGGDVPVDAADVVAGAVGAGLAGFGAPAGDQAQEVAVEHPVELAVHVEGQPAEDLLGRAVPDETEGVRQAAHEAPFPQAAAAPLAAGAFHAPAAVDVP